MDEAQGEVVIDPTDGGEEIVTAGNRIGHKVPHLVVDGVDERDIFAYAPTMICDRVHWDTVDDFDARRLVNELRMEAYTRQWCLDHDVEAVNIRVEAKVPYRNLELIPGTLLQDMIAAAVQWLYPRSYSVRKKIVADLELVEDDDVKSMMYLFVSDHADRFDGGRQGRNGTLSFLAFMIGKLRTWPQDAARTAFGRTVISDRIALHRAGDSVAFSEHRQATTVERADALGTSVTDLRRREQTIATLSNLRNPQSLVVAGSDQDVPDTVQVTGDTDVAKDALSYTRDSELTRAILAAVNHPEQHGRRPQDPLALAAVYLSFWEGLSRPDVARELEVLPKTANAAVTRVLESVQAADVL